MIEKNIPKHWQVKTLGEICNIVYGKGLPVKELKTSGFPVFGANGIIGFNDKYLFEESQVLISCRGAASGKINQSPPKCYVTNNSLVLDIKKKDELSKTYLFYALSIAKKTKLVTGTAQPQVTINNAVELKIPFPPLHEQQAIVAKIEELLSDLENGKQQLQTAQQQLKVYRQSLLKWAFEGKLTNKNVKDGELPVDWKWVKLGEVCNKIQDGSHFSPQIQYDEPGENRFMYITAKNIRNDYMDFRKLIYVDKDYHESIYCRCNPEFGDVLLTKDGINTGDVTLNTLHEPFSLLSSVCIFKTKQNDLLSSFLKYFIQSPFGNKAILESMTGTAIKRIVLRKIKDAKIILPTLLEQHRIVLELESKLTVCDKIAETISQSLLQAETLRQSILKKAFEGKLV